MALDTTHRLDDLTVAQLRQMARERGIKRFSKMKKAELVKVLERAEHDERGEAAAPSMSATAPWSQQETLTEDRERGDGNRATADHEEIRAWADARSAVPAMEEMASAGDETTVLRFRFPLSPPGRLQQIDWPTWFGAFDTRRLRFIYLVPTDGSQSNYFQLERR